MGARLSPQIWFENHTIRKGVPFSVWLGARIAALILGMLLLLLLWQLKPPPSAPEPLAIQGVNLAKLEAAAPKPAIETREPPPPPPQSQAESAQQVPAQAVRAANSAPNVKDRPTPRRSRSQAGVNQSPQGPGAEGPRATTGPSTVGGEAPQAPRIATSPAGQAGGTPAAGGGGTHKGVSSRTMAILRARECARLDIRDRPPDCPPNEELQRLLAQERGPHYRPENAEAFSRNELAWRGIPEPCLDDGENAAIKGTTLCIRFGNVPSRVRSVREICEARGLGGCQDAPGQEAVNAAVEQVRRAQKAKSAGP
jgi:hypothetical protein